MVGMINILEYQYADNKGAAINGQTFASPLAYNGTDVDYSSAKVAHEGVAEANLNTDGSYTPRWTPIRGKVYVMTADGPVEVALNANGAIPAENIRAGNEISYWYDNETVPVDAPAIKLDIRSIPVETKSRKLKAIWSFDAQYELLKEYGSDMRNVRVKLA